MESRWKGEAARSIPRSRSGSVALRTAERASGVAVAALRASVVAELAAGSGLTLEPRGEHRLRGDDAVRLLAHTAGLH